MLSTNELSELRSVAVIALTDRCDVQRRTAVRDGLDRTHTWTAIATDVPCRITAQGEVAREYIQGGSVVGSTDLILRLPYGTNVTNKDRVIVFVDDTTITYEVMRVLTRSNATVTSAVVQETK